MKPLNVPEVYRLDIYNEVEGIGALCASFVEVDEDNFIARYGVAVEEYGHQNVRAYKTSLLAWEEADPPSRQPVLAAA